VSVRQGVSPEVDEDIITAFRDEQYGNLLRRISNIFKRHWISTTASPKALEEESFATISPRLG
jgi:hypothetical protein